jgi:hypothetical protein
MATSFRQNCQNRRKFARKIFFWECDQIWQKFTKNLQWDIPHFFRVLFVEVEKFAPSSPEKKKKKGLGFRVIDLS